MKKLLLVFSLALLLTGCFKKEEEKKPETTPDQNQEEKDATMAKPAITTPKPAERTISDEPKQDAPKPRVRRQDFEISADENGLVIKSFRGRKIDKVVSENPAQNVSFNDEFLIFDEKNGDIWVSKTINLSAYAEYLTEK